MSEEKSFCRKCGAEIKERSAFCSKCGAQLDFPSEMIPNKSQFTDNSADFTICNAKSKKNSFAKKLLYGIVGITIGIFFLLVVVVMFPPSSHTSTSASVASITPISTNSAAYEDADWLSNVHDHANSLAYDMDGISTSIKKGDFSSLQGYSECMMMETDDAIKETRKFNISPKYKTANDEWIAGLQDYNSGAKDARQLAIDAQNGKINAEATSEGATLCKQGTIHMSNAKVLIKAAS